MEELNNTEEGMFSIISSYIINTVLVGIIFFLIWKIWRSRYEDDDKPIPKTPSLPPMKKRDFTIEELTEYDGIKNERVLIAVNGKVFDVTKGKQFYGPGGPYAVFAGHDASRGLATFSLETVNDKYDDLSDLKSHEMESVLEWEMQFKEKYDYIGRLLKPGENHNSYSDDENEVANSLSTKPKDD